MNDRWNPLAHLGAAGIDLPDGTDLGLVGSDPVIAARHRVGEAAAVAAGAAGAWAAHFGELRGLPPQSVTVDVTAAATALLGFAFQSVDGKVDLARWSSPVTDLFRTADDRLIHLHGGFPHLADGTARLLGCRPDPDALSRAVARWDAAELEDALAGAGMCGVVVRSPEEWAEHPHGRRVVDRAGVRLTRLGDADPLARHSGDRPLAGIRVLDQTRVLAGPTVGRTLAGFGAEVLRVDGPRLPTIEAFAIETGRGKRRALCDLDDPDDVARLLTLADEADVVVHGYRPGALEARGLGPSDLAARRPGVVVVEVSCYGADGPWSTRRGWEQLAQATSGVAHGEDPERPRLVPAAATDYTTGYLGAAGAVEALVRQASEGGSWLVEVSLCATAAWLVRLGTDLDPGTACGLGDVAARQQLTATEWGPLMHLGPVEHLSVTPSRWDRPPCGRGTHALEWTH
ncbi:MAG: CoA transferase [Acidimicrobiia bacterium]|nr:CoA transferase [Acidimicrobiia bacterium]